MEMINDPVWFRGVRSRDIGGTQLTRQAARTVGWPHSWMLAEDGSMLLAEDYGRQEAEVGDQR